MTKNIGNAWTALEGALKTHAPRLLADLAGPASDLDLAASKPLPTALAALYKRHDGQRREHRDGLFSEGYFLPLRGADSVESERAHHPGILVFAKDFGGSWVGLVTDSKVGFSVGTVVAFEEDAKVIGPTLAAVDVGTYLTNQARALGGGERVVDERHEQILTISFPFGGPRPRVVDDPALRAAGITLEILDTARGAWTASPFQQRAFPSPAQGIFLRCSAPGQIIEPALELEGEGLSEGHGSGPIVVDGQTLTGCHWTQASGILPAAWQARISVRVSLRLLA